MPDEVTAWPSALNPCTDTRHHLRQKAADYGVEGRVTKLCVYCVEDNVEAQKREGLTKNDVLNNGSFRPDPTGALVK